MHLMPHALKKDAFFYSAIIVLFAVLLAVSTYLNRDTLNDDAASYINLAIHYVAGDFQVAVSGYWSPLISWILAGLILVIGDPILAARLAMTLSAMVFFGGAASVLLAIQNRAVRMAGLLISACLAAEAAGEFITPDLLSAGLYCLGCQLLFRSLREPAPLRALLSGGLFGLAYLAKAVLFPVTLLMLATLALVMLWTRTLSFRVCAAQMAACLVGLMVIASPWIMVLSIKYHELTFATTGRVVSGLIAPPDIRRDHPTSQSFVVPEKGRQSQWEDESILPSVKWSPFQSKTYFAYFAETILTRIPAVLETVRSFDWSGLGLLGAVYFFLPYVWRRSHLARDPYGLFLVPIMWPLIVYLPIQFPWPVDWRRYFLVVTVFVIACSLEASRLIGQKIAGRQGQHWLLLANLALMLAAVAAATPGQLFRSDQTKQLRFAEALAPLLSGTPYVGAMATLGRNADGRASSYLSLLLRTPWLGHPHYNGVDEVLASCVRLVFVFRGTRNELIMEQHPDVFADVAEIIPAIKKVDSLGQRLFWIKPPSDAMAARQNCSL